MKYTKKQSKRQITINSVTLLLAGVALMPGMLVQAQDGGYQVGEARQGNRDNRDADHRTTSVEAKRMARVDYMDGNVTWRPDEDANWQKASRNLSLRAGAQVWATNGGRAEIRFDDGSLLRLGNNAIVTIQTVYSDSQGPHIQIRMQAGLATLRLARGRTEYEVETPFATIHADGPARIRLGVADTAEVGVSLGQASIEGSSGDTVVHAGSLLVARDGDTSYDVRSLPREDSWERWNDERDRLLVRKNGSAVYGPETVVITSPPPVVVAPAPPAFRVGLDFVFGSGYRYRSYGRWGRGGHWRR